VDDAKILDAAQAERMATLALNCSSMEDSASKKYQYHLTRGKKFLSQKLFDRAAEDFGEALDVAKEELDAEWSLEAEDFFDQVKAAAEAEREATEYQGTRLAAPDREAMLELECLIANSVPSLPDGDSNTYGFFAKDEHIEILRLGGLMLKSLPDSIGNLVSLKELHLSSNRITCLPENIGDLKLLKKLHLNKNRLVSLPESLGNLKSLTELDLSDNQVASLPDSLGNLINLENLLLNNNPLKSLPETFLQISELKTLSVDEHLYHYNYGQLWGDAVAIEMGKRGVRVRSQNIRKKPKVAAKKVSRRSQRGDN
jgi:hypothetical protein